MGMEYINVNVNFRQLNKTTDHAIISRLYGDYEFIRTDESLKFYLKDQTNLRFFTPQDKENHIFYTFNTKQLSNRDNLELYFLLDKTNNDGFVFTRYMDEGEDLMVFTNKDGATNANFGRELLLSFPLAIYTKNNEVAYYDNYSKDVLHLRGNQSMKNRTKFTIYGLNEDDTYKRN